MEHEQRFQHLRRRLLAFAFADEFVPLYAFYALLFADNGLSTGQLSIALASWSLTGMLLEVPSGALADRVSRRGLLAVATALKAAGWAVWLLVPAFAGVIVGFVLWGASTAAVSGTFEALVYDELDRIDRAGRYTALTARLSQVSNVAIAASSLTAAPLVAVVGMVGVGWVSVAIAGLAVVAVLRLPEAPAVEVEGTGFRAWWGTLRDGVSAARRTPVLARLVVLGALAEGVAFIDEYLPLAARERGAGDVVVPLIALVAWIGFIVGAEVAARRPHLSARVAALLSLVGAAGAAAALLSGAAVGISLFALLYAGMQTTSVLTEARLQEHAPAATRATVTSVRGVLMELMTLLGFAAVGAVTVGAGLTAGISVILLPALAVAVLADRWLPPPAQTRPAGDEPAAPGEPAAVAGTALDG